MKVIGVIGGVASGKSTVAREFARLGAVVLDADESARRALEEPDVRAALVDRWGKDILLPDGGLDRAAISRQVFAQDGAGAASEERAFLEGLVHPRVRLDLERQLDAFAESGAGVVVLDVPLLVEVGWESMCDVVYFVDAPEVARIERARMRGWSEDEFRSREAAQAPLDQKRRWASSILQNSGDLEELRRQVAVAYQDLMRPSVPRPKK